MSELESSIWLVLGYLSLPGVFIGGFIAVALVSVPLLSFIKEKPQHGSTAAQSAPQDKKLD